MFNFDSKLSDLTFGQMIFVALIVLLGVIVVKVTITFDWNKYLEVRQNNFYNKLQNTCLHIELSTNKNGDPMVKGLFESPYGTTQWQCNKCKLIKNNVDQNEINKIGQYYLNNIKEYQKRNKKFIKLLKSAGMV